MQLVRLTFLFLTVLVLAACGPSPEEKARAQALRDSTSIDSALKREVFLKLQENKLRQRKLDSIRLKETASQKDSSNRSPARDSTRRFPLSDSSAKASARLRKNAKRKDSARKSKPAADIDTSSN